ncbi:MAG: hypothetical protein Fur002_15540 [Anaerolineales bacterium]
MAEKGNRSIRAGNGSVVVGGDVKGSNIVIGNHNTVSSQTLNIDSVFETVYRRVDENPALAPDKKEDVKAELAEVKTALEQPQPDEGFLARRFRSLQNMAPDIVDVTIELLKNPVTGVAEVIKKVAQKIKDIK